MRGSTDSSFNHIAAAVVLWYVISGWAYPRISELMSAAGWHRVWFQAFLGDLRAFKKNKTAAVFSASDLGSLCDDNQERIQKESLSQLTSRTFRAAGLWGCNWSSWNGQECMRLLEWKCLRMCLSGWLDSLTVAWDLVSMWGDVICMWILLNWCLHKLMFSTKQQPSSYQGALFSIYFCPQLLSQPLTHVWVGLSLWNLFQLHSLHHRRAEVSGENSSMKLK